eukprot:8243852-Pyramimonas_sp.AAC.2
MMDQSDVGSEGIFLRWTNQTQEAQVCSHDEPIRHRKRGYIPMMGQSDAGSRNALPPHLPHHRHGLLPPLAALQCQQHRRVHLGTSSIGQSMFISGNLTQVAKHQPKWGRCDLRNRLPRT